MHRPSETSPGRRGTPLGSLRQKGGFPVDSWPSDRDEPPEKPPAALGPACRAALDGSSPERHPATPAPSRWTPPEKQGEPKACACVAAPLERRHRPGRPRAFPVTVRQVLLAGAGFVVPGMGELTTVPAPGFSPNLERYSLDAGGRIFPTGFPAGR